MHTATPTTTITCPSWCDKQPGHHFDSQDPATPVLAYRYHARDVAEVPMEDRRSALVRVSSLESARHGQLDLTRPAVVQMFGYEDGHGLTGDQARALATALQAAADLHDEIHGDAS